MLSLAVAGLFKCRGRCSERDALYLPERSQAPAHLGDSPRHESEPLWNQLMVRLVPGEANHLSLSMRVSNAAVMHLIHLGLPVRGLRRSQEFYSAYFGFDPATAREYEDGTVIIRNADGFDLALHPVEQVEPSPAFLHAGFMAAEPAEVRMLMERMEADGVTIVERNDEAAYVAFKCRDPYGHLIEVYCEPPRSR